MQNSLIFSLTLHLIILILLYFGLPSLFQKPLQQEKSVSIELLPITDLSNVKPKQKSTETESKIDEGKMIVKASKEKSQIKPQPQEKTEPEKKEKTKDPKKTELMPEKEKTKAEIQKQEKPKPDPKKKDITKKQEIKKPQPKKKDNDNELDSLLKTLDNPSDKKTDKAQKNQSKSSESKEENQDSERLFDPSIDLSMSETDAIRSQIEKNWTLPAGAKNIDKMSVTLKISLAKDGTVTDIKVTNKSNYSDNDAIIFRAFADSVVRAALMSSPLQNLPVEKYKKWQELELHFDPTKAL